MNQLVCQQAPRCQPPLSLSLERLRPPRKALAGPETPRRRALLQTKALGSDGRVLGLQSTAAWAPAGPPGTGWAGRPRRRVVRGLAQYQLTLANQLLGRLNRPGVRERRGSDNETRWDPRAMASISTVHAS